MEVPADFIMLEISWLVLVECCSNQFGLSIKVKIMKQLVWWVKAVRLV